MKNFSEFNEAKKAEELNIQDDTINYANVEDLKSYLTIANKYLSPETKEIIDWLIVNNETYLHDLDPKGTAENALAAFYNRGVPSEEDLKELYKCIGKVKLADRLLEIPVFQTKEQFQEFCNSAGISLSAAITIFLRSVIRENKLPFEIKGTRSISQTRPR